MCVGVTVLTDAEISAEIEKLPGSLQGKVKTAIDTYRKRNAVTGKVISITDTTTGQAPSCDILFQPCVMLDKLVNNEYIPQPALPVTQHIIA